MFPYHDENETQRTPVVTFVLIGLNVVAWMLLQGAGAELPLAKSVCELGLIPAELLQTRPVGSRFPMGNGIACLTDPGRQVGNILSSMFLHGSWMHLLGNMWFLWLFGNNIEDSMNRGAFLAFYLTCGLTAALAQAVTNPTSVVPMVGASGAISGVMGAYLVLFPRVRVFCIVPLGIILTRMALPAWVMLLYWAFLQLASGLMTGAHDGGGVAFWAHIGGFVAGVVLVKPLVRQDLLIEHRRHRWLPERS
ncbi:MAG: rhomboid family intramembrane serine protease [Deltaproteobacteria bacterium]|nr:rhomboid family intramembrane serine protease [Deltaproteobacteria bacterium]